MMQDTILSMCKNSVREFVAFMIKYIPKETSIHSTSKVVNIFEKLQTLENDLDQREEIPEDQMDAV